MKLIDGFLKLKKNVFQVGKKESFDRPFSLLKFENKSTDPVCDDMFSVVPDLFAPLIDEEVTTYIGKQAFVAHSVKDKNIDVSGQVSLQKNNNINTLATNHTVADNTVSSDSLVSIENIKSGADQLPNSIAKMNLPLKDEKIPDNSTQTMKKIPNVADFNANSKPSLSNVKSTIILKSVVKEKLTAQQIKDNESQKRIEERRRREIEHKLGRGRFDELESKFPNRGKPYSRGRFDDTSTNKMTSNINQVYKESVDEIDSSSEKNVYPSGNQAASRGRPNDNHGSGEKLEDKNLPDIHKGEPIGVKAKGQKQDKEVEIHSIERKRKSRWDIKDKTIENKDYNTLADDFLGQHTKDNVNPKSSKSTNNISISTCSVPKASIASSKTPASNMAVQQSTIKSTVAITSATQISSAPLIPPQEAVFPSIDPYASCPPIFNPTPLANFPPAMSLPPNMPMPPNMPLPPTMPLPPSMLMPQPTNLLLPPNMPPMPNMPFPPTSMHAPLPPPPPVTVTEEDELNHYVKTEPFVNRSDIDNTPNPSINIGLDPTEVEIFIPEFFAERYPDHPHKGVTKADPDVALKEALEKEKRSKEPLPESIHSRMFTIPIMKLNEEVGTIDTDDYPSLRGEVKPIIKPNQKFVVIGTVKQLCIHTEFISK